jgi:hypothetical protein
MLWPKSISRRGSTQHHSSGNLATQDLFAIDPGDLSIVQAT